ncbi:MAG: hypothetical protein C0507_20635 [Cyanobacteria bacterium PR.3.49]|nr:hypothetical protein [Cyanobacteria bacterium PR.3.49]
MDKSRCLPIKCCGFWRPAKHFALFFGCKKCTATKRSKLVRFLFFLIGFYLSGPIAAHPKRQIKD